MALIDYALVYDSDTGDWKHGKVNKVEQAIARLKGFEPPEGYFLAFSGGKDSVVLRRLADMAEVKYEPHYHITTLDPPELIRFINQQHKDVVRDRPALNAWDLMVDTMRPPTRLCRYCCRTLKESHGRGLITLTGARWAESNSRKTNQGIITMPIQKRKDKSLIYNEDNNEARRMVENCYRTRKTLLNPMVDWQDVDVWEFIEVENVPYCGLYDEGINRLGCIGCPEANKLRFAQFERWPTYKEKYLQTFARIIEHRKELGKNTLDNWTSAEAMFAWWMEEPEDKPYELGLFDVDWQEK